MKGNYIKSVRLYNEKVKEEYPYTIKAIRKLGELKFSRPVTFFVGDNGTGKSTLLEAIAISFGFNPEGGSKFLNMSTYNSHSNLSENIVINKGFKLAKDGFFLRSESFYNVATEVDVLDSDPFTTSLLPLYGGVSLHKQSHGESFLSLINNRFSGFGLYILDEPEAALSPIAQLSLLKRIQELVENSNSQFIIATHSPILINYPNADIYQFSEEGIDNVSISETMVYSLYKRIMNDENFINSFLKE